MSLPRVAIARPVAVAMFFLGVVFLGVLSFARLPIDLLPDVAYPRLVVYTTDAGAAPAEVERFVTEPVEQAVSTVPGVQGVESVTREGASLVTARFAWGTDMEFAALNVREKLDNIRDQLPELAARPVVLRTDPRSEPVMALGVAGGRDLPGLKELAELVFKRRLEQIDGVALAQVTGGVEREIHVDVDPRALESFGLTVQDVAAALKDANAQAPGGTIRRGRYRYALRTLGELQGVEEIAAVPVRKAGAALDSTGARVLLRDVAAVEDGFQERESLARYNGQESVGLLVYKNADANTVRVAREVEKTLAQLRREYPDVKLQVAMSQAGFISDALANVVQEVILGGIMAFLVLFLFLREARYPVAIALAIPISLIATFALMHATGVSLNILSLGGMALGVGMLMDNSIVVLENVFRHRELGLRAAPGRRRGRGGGAARHHRLHAHDHRRLRPHHLRGGGRGRAAGRAGHDGRLLAALPPSWSPSPCSPRWPRAGRARRGARARGASPASSPPCWTASTAGSRASPPSTSARCRRPCGAAGGRWASPSGCWPWGCWWDGRCRAACCRRWTRASSACGWSCRRARRWSARRTRRRGWRRCWTPTPPWRPSLPAWAGRWPPRGWTTARAG